MKNERNDILIKFRPLLKQSIILNNTNELEVFQNNTLRPIIKFQHELLVLVLKNYLISNKFDIVNTNTEKLSKFTSIAIKNDKQLNLQITHSITGLFTKREFDYYSQNKKEIHKRIIQICTERYLTNLEQLK